MNKLLIIVGPTATGKTALAVKLAKKFNGEIISADSRQIYQGMDIGTGKDIGNSKFKIQNSKLKAKIQKEISLKITLGIYLINKVPVWGLDLIKPSQRFSVAHWLCFARHVRQDICQRNKMPIVVGGTGFWIRALVKGIDTLGISPNWQLREKLKNLEIEKLREILKKLDEQKLKQMNKSDQNNPRRLIRAIEISLALKTKSFPQKTSRQLPIDQLLMVGLKAPSKFLYQKIDQRVEKRIQQGSRKEIAQLIKEGYSWELPAMSALGYQEWRPFWENKASLEEVIKRWKYDEHAYARRQLTWFKKNQKIHWFNVSQKHWQKNVVKLVTSWYDRKNGKN